MALAPDDLTAAMAPLMTGPHDVAEHARRSTPKGDAYLMLARLERHVRTLDEDTRRDVVAWMKRSARELARVEIATA